MRNDVQIFFCRFSTISAATINLMHFCCLKSTHVNTKKQTTVETRHATLSTQSA